MEKQLLRYLSQTIEIIYCGEDGVITQRKIEVHSIEDGVVKAFCLSRCSRRLFRIENILAVQPVRRAS